MKCFVVRKAKMQATYVEGESLEDYNARLRANAEEVEAPPEALNSLNIGCVTVLDGDMYARTLEALTGEELLIVEGNRRLCFPNDQLFPDLNET